MLQFETAALEGYRKGFRDNAVDACILANLIEEDLFHMGVADAEHRKRM